jgi:hypothetical protein
MVRNKNACELKYTHVSDEKTKMYQSNTFVIDNVQEFKEFGYGMQKCQFPPVKYITWNSVVH